MQIHNLDNNHEILSSTLNSIYKLCFDFNLEDLTPTDEPTNTNCRKRIKLTPKNQECLFPLYICLADPKEFTLKKVDAALEEICLDNFYFLITPENAVHIVPLLKLEIYQYSLLPLREAEFMANIHFYFSKENQKNLFRKIDLNKIELTTKENKILDALFEKGNQGLTRSELIEVGWNNLNVYHKTLDVHLFNLRKKIQALKLEIQFENQAWKLNLSNRFISE